MRQLIAIAFLSISSAFAETAVIPVLRVGDRDYTNARISSVVGGDAIVLFDGGGKRIPLGDLPADLQKQYTPAPLSPEQQKTADEQKQKIEEQRAALAKVAAWRGEPKRVSIRSVNPSGTYGVSVEGEGSKEIRINNLPGSAAQFFNNAKAIATQVETIEAEVKVAKRAYEDLPISYSGSPAFVAAMDAKIQAAKDKLRAAEDRLEALERQQRSLLQTRKDATEVMARKTAQVYGRWEIWEYYGPALERSTQAQ